MKPEAGTGWAIFSLVAFVIWISYSFGQSAGQQKVQDDLQPQIEDLQSQLHDAADCRDTYKQWVSDVYDKAAYASDYDGLIDLQSTAEDTLNAEPGACSSFP